MERVNGGMKRSSSENATNATRDPETMFSQVAGAGAGGTGDFGGGPFFGKSPMGGHLFLAL